MCVCVCALCVCGEDKKWCQNKQVKFCCFLSVYPLPMVVLYMRSAWAIVEKSSLDAYHPQCVMRCFIWATSSIERFSSRETNLNNEESKCEKNMAFFINWVCFFYLGYILCWKTIFMRKYNDKEYWMHQDTTIVLLQNVQEYQKL